MDSDARCSRFREIGSDDSPAAHLQKAMRWAEAGEFDLLWTESPDRLARKIAGMAELYDRLKFAGRRWHTTTRGEMDDMKLAFSGYESQSYLTDLAHRTRRGLLGCVADGRSCGARPYGYDLDRDTRMVPDKHRPGKLVPQAGVLKLNTERLPHVLRAMQLFDSGFSPDALAKLLNDERIPSPSGGPWRASTLRGDSIRGVGILRNQIYIGKLIGGRFSWRRDPKTGKRKPFLNPESEWVITDVPHLRVPGLTDELFSRVQAKLAATRTRVKAAGATRRRPHGTVRERMPTFALSGLTKCVCGGGFTIAHRGMLQCNNYRKAGRSICTNERSISYLDVERRVLVAVEQHLTTKDRCDEILRLYTTEINRLHAEHRAKQADAPRELESVKRRALEILNWMQQGFKNPAGKPKWSASVSVSLNSRPSSRRGRTSRRCRRCIRPSSS